MASLYSLTGEWLELYSMMDQDDAEENADLIFDTIEGIEGEIEDKADGYAKVIAMITSDMKAKEEEIKRLQEAKKRDENNIKRLNESLMGAMKFTGKTKFKTALFSFSVAKNGGKAPLHIYDGVEPERLDEKFQKVTIDIDKDAVRSALEAGEKLNFAQIGERGESLRIK